jgi:hypothetical protein
VRRRRNRNFYFAAAACTVLAFSAMVTLRLSGTATHAPLAAPPEFAAMTAPSGMNVPANRALVKANLHLTRSAEGEIRKALRQSPGDASLKRLLDTTSQQQRELDQLLLADRQ